MIRFHALFSSLFLSVVLAGTLPALAQQRTQPAQAPQAQAPQAQAPAAPGAAPAPVAVPSEPQSTMASFGDWALRCVRQGEGAQATRTCEVTQNIQVQGQQGPLAQIAFGRVQRTDPLRLTAVLPANVSFPSVVRVMLDEKDTQPFDLAWARCVPGACVAYGEPAQAVIQRFRARTEPARLIFKDSSGRDIAVPLSFRGLSQALDAMAKEA